MNSSTQPIKYGMFIMPFHPPEKPLAQGYDEDLELVVQAEELGFSEISGISALTPEPLDSTSPVGKCPTIEMRSDWLVSLLILL